MTHERFADSVGAYLLGALPEGERDAFERHLDGCAICREEVAELRVAAEALPHAVEPMAPPASLKASLMEVVEREATTPARAPARRARRRLTFTLPRLRPATAALAASVLLALGVVAGYGVAGLGGDDPRTVAASVDSARLGGARASVTIPPDGGQAVLRVRDMPATGPESVYQVWLRRGDRVTSQSLFAVGADGSGAAAIPASVEGADAVMVTREPAGGSRAPTEAPRLTVEL